MRIALDATYSIGDQLTGVGVYSTEIIRGVAAHCPERGIVLAYRPHRFLRAIREPRPAHSCRRILLDRLPLPSVSLFHGLNQRLPSARYKRAVATFHDLFVLTGDYSTAEFRQRFAAQAREAAERSDLIISVSQFTAEQVHDVLGVERSRIRVVHHGIHTPTRKARKIRERMILTVGAIQKRKNTSRLISAFENVSAEWRLVIAGSAGYGAEEVLAQLRRSAARDRITVTGYVDRDTLTDLYSRASVFAFPSLDEGFGIPVLEAMAWGIPVLTSDRSALPEVGGGSSLLHEPPRHGGNHRGTEKSDGEFHNPPKAWRERTATGQVFPLGRERARDAFSIRGVAWLIGLVNRDLERP